jgi:hypothetical protein
MTLAPMSVGAPMRLTGFMKGDPFADLGRGSRPQLPWPTLILDPPMGRVVVG